TAFKIPFSRDAQRSAGGIPRGAPAALRCASRLNEFLLGNQLRSFRFVVGIAPEQEQLQELDVRVEVELQAVAALQADVGAELARVAGRDFLPHRLPEWLVA